MSSANTEMNLSDESGYNKIYKYSWVTSTNGLPMSAGKEISKLARGRWGWHFVPHENMDYSSDSWYENQTLVLTFERKWDLIMSRLCVHIG